MMKSLLIFLLLFFLNVTAYAEPAILSQNHLVLSAASFFGIGILLAFTPCVLPMIPILSAILMGQEQRNSIHAFILSSIFVLSMAFTYAAAGLLVGYLGNTLQTILQTPVVLVSFSLIFVLMALSMFNLFQVQIPHAIQTSTQKMQSKLRPGSYLGVAIMGVLSTLIASPCVTAPLVSVLTYISQTGNSLYGGTILFFMALGMGVPLILFGVSQHAFLPKTGPWMNDIKHLFGIILLGLAVWILSRVIEPIVTMYLWAILLIISSVAMDSFNFQKAMLPIIRGINIFAFLFGCIILIGAAKGNDNIFLALQSIENHPVLSQRPASALFNYAATQQDLEAKLNKAKALNKPAIIEFFASWCPDCKKVDSEVLSDADIRSNMRSMTSIRVDVSERNPELSKMMEHYKIYGVPTMLFFNKDGKQYASLNDITKQSMLEQIKVATK